MGLGHPYSEQWHHPSILIQLRPWQMQCFTYPELEAGEIHVRGPFGNPVPASLEHSEVRREAKKARKSLRSSSRSIAAGRRRLSLKQTALFARSFAFLSGSERQQPRSQPPGPAREGG